MATVDLKLYQVGTFAAGNRLLPLEDRTVQAQPDRSNAITSGHRACQGCGEVLGARYVLDAAMRATMQRVVAVNMGALAASMLGLMAVVLGIMLR